MNIQRVFLFLLVFSLTFTSFGASFAMAESDKEKLQELLEQAEEYKEVIEKKQSQESSLDNQIDVLSTRVNRLEKDIESNQEKLLSTSEEIEMLGTQIQENQRSIDNQKALLTELLVIYYDSRTENVFVTAFQDPWETIFSGGQDRVEILQGKVTDVLDSIVKLQEKMENQKVELGSKKVELENLHGKLEKQGEYLEVSKVQKESLLSKTQSEREQYEKRLTETQKKIQELENEIAGIEAGSNYVSSLPPAKKGLLRYPVGTPVRVTQYYGMTSYARGGAYGGAPHNGVDFGAPMGSGIYAAGNGRVIGTGDMGRYAYGKWIAIEHGNGITTLYGHLSKILVSKGDSVKEGERIGLMGSTGYSTGPHLHFGVYGSSSFDIVNSKSVGGLKVPTGKEHRDPMKYLK